MLRSTRPRQLVAGLLRVGQSRPGALAEGDDRGEQPGERQPHSEHRGRQVRRRRRSGGGGVAGFAPAERPPQHQRNSAGERAGKRGEPARTAALDAARIQPGGGGNGRPGQPRRQGETRQAAEAAGPPEIDRHTRGGGAERRAGQRDEQDGGVETEQLRRRRVDVAVVHEHRDRREADDGRVDRRPAKGHAGPQAGGEAEPPRAERGGMAAGAGAPRRDAGERPGGAEHVRRGLRLAGDVNVEGCRDAEGGGEPGREPASGRDHAIGARAGGGRVGGESREHVGTGGWPGVRRRTRVWPRRAPRSTRPTPPTAAARTGWRRRRSAP